MARLLFLLSLLLVTPALRGEFPISTSEPGPRPGGKGGAHVVRVGGGYAVLWADSAATGVPGWIAGSLVDEDGGLLRSFKPVRLQQQFPSFPGTIAAGGDQVLIPGECLSPKGIRSVCITWVDSDRGSIGEPQLIEEDAVSASAAWNGREFLLTYVARPFSTHLLRARTISVQGDVAEPLTLGPSYRGAHTPAAAAVGESFFLGWYDTGKTSQLTEIAGDSIRATSALDAPVRQPGATAHLSMQSSGDELMIVTGHGSARRFRNRVAVTPWMTLGRGFQEIQHPRALRTAQGWVIVFAVPVLPLHELRSSSIAEDGTFGNEVLLGTQLGAFHDFDTAESSTGFALTWARVIDPNMKYPAGSDVVFLGVGQNGVARHDPKIVSIGVASQDSPTAVFGGNAYLVAWTERNGEKTQIRAQRLGLEGQKIGAQLTIPASNEHQTHPAIAFNGESFLLIWSEGLDGRRGVRGTRIGAEGTVLDPVGIEIAGETAPPPPWLPSSIPRTADVAWSGTNWIIASEEVNGIGVRRIAPGGSVLDRAPVLLPKAADLQRIPLIDCPPGGPCLVAWQAYIQWDCQMTCEVSRDSVVVARLTSNLHPVDATPIRLNEKWDGAGGPGTVSTAWNEIQGSWMVTWSGPVGRRVPKSGGVLDPGFRAGGDFVSIVAERTGWRGLWTTAEPQVPAVLSGWMGLSADILHIEQQRFVAPPRDANLAVFLAAGPGPLALYVQSDRMQGGARRVFAQYLDAATPARRRAVTRR